MTSRFRLLAGIVALVAMAAVLSAVPRFESARESLQPEGAEKQVMPKYERDGALLLPKDWRQWVFAGSSLGLSYSENAAPGPELFHEVLMEPTAYRHFAETGKFREGTMFVLVLHGIGENVLPARRGRFAADLRAVEMAVKDTAHRPEGWAYYNFGGRNGIRPTAPAMPKESCYNCHIQHAKRDNVFMQFYPLLESVAPPATP